MTYNRIVETTVLVFLNHYSFITNKLTFSPPAQITQSVHAAQLQS